MAINGKRHIICVKNRVFQLCKYGIIALLVFFGFTGCRPGCYHNIFVKGPSSYKIESRKYVLPHKIVILCFFNTLVPSFRVFMENCFSLNINLVLYITCMLFPPFFFLVFSVIPLTTRMRCIPMWLFYFRFYGQWWWYDCWWWSDGTSY